MLSADYSHASYANNPPKFVREVLGVVPEFNKLGQQTNGNYRKQDDILMSVLHNPRTTVRAPNGTGKCPEWSEPIRLADGSTRKACELIGTRFVVKSWHNNKPCTAHAEACDNGFRDVWRLTTDSGCSILRSANHPLLNPQSGEWKHIEAFKCGDLIAMAPDASGRIVIGRVRSVEYQGVARTVAISVPGPKTFITDFIEHNSELAAEAVIWATSVFPDCRVITTAASGRQVKLMWEKINRIYARAPVPLGGKILQTELRFPKLGSLASGFSTDSPGRFEGVHANRVLVVMDEAKSIPQVIFDAVERVLTSGEWVRLLIISSPGSPIGPFYDTFHKNGDIYTKFHITMGESPYVRPEFMEERKRKWGEASPLYMSAIKGDFSIDADGRIVIPLTYVQRIAENPPEWSDDRTPCMGIDLAAGGGDESAVSLMVGNKQVALKRWNERDTMVTCGNIIRLFKQYQTEYGLHEGQVNIDEGGLGKGVCDRLAEVGYHFNRFNFGSAAVDGSAYYDAGAEVWYTTGKLIENQQISLIDSSSADAAMSLHDLQCQLSGRMTKPRSDGLIQLESKEEMRKRQLPSPDLADATVLSIAGRRSTELTFLSSTKQKATSLDEADREEELRERVKQYEREAQKKRELEDAPQD